MECKPNVDVSIYITRNENNNTVGSDGVSLEKPDGGISHFTDDNRLLLPGNTFMTQSYMSCIEAGVNESGLLHSEAFADMNHHKLDVEKVLNGKMDCLDSGSRVFIAVCGPRLMADEVRQVSRRLMIERNVMADVHLEAFG
jgi:hypothetical protein